MKQHRPPFPLMLVIYCLCTAQFTSGFPQPFAGYLSESDIPKNERLALCFSQWIEQSDQPQISSSVMDLCNSMFNSMQIDEESEMAAAEFTKKHELDALGRPFFLFRPRNGRTVDGGGEYAI
ncbi:neuromedin-S isoform X3 [Sphaerodactylus townsendi]|uniref:neuromedin-S isoform X3 n=1 Tax=Sphaerodactylus townsendi TaxID=933632 RepID=UPI0020264A15|nr:neuromedin-S isoform X3 [Sphaerodactylus townsendi]